MRAKLFITSLILCSFAFLILLIPTTYSVDLNERGDFYESCIVRKIKKCDSRAFLFRSSRSKNLREYAELEAQKAAFFDKEKEILIKQMVEMQIEPKHYKIDLFLNSQFQKKVQHTK